MDKTYYDFLLELRTSGFSHHTPESINRLIYALLSDKQKDFDKIEAYLDGDPGILSKNKIRDMRNLIIGSSFLLCSYAGEHHANMEYAYTLGDYFINQAESLTTANQFAEMIRNIFSAWKKLFQDNKKNDFGYQINRCIHYIDQNLYTSITLQDVAKYMNLTPSYLTELFKQKVGKSLYQYIKEKKLQEAKLLLTHSHYPLSLIADSLGYNSLAHFSAAFKSEFHISPSKYRNINNTI